MANYLMIVYGNPVEGQEEEFNDWYNNTHIHEIVEKVPGMVSAQRFALDPKNSKDNHPSHKYLAIYDVETDDPEKTFEALSKLVEAGKLEGCDALCRDTLGRGFYAPVTDKILEK